MPRTASPDVRRALVERAAEMLARREPVTLRSVVAGTGASTMAVYTHFDGMPGLWRAVRQEGFGRLADQLAGVETTRDPVRDLTAYGVAYLSNALAHPALYRAMFDDTSELDDPDAAGAPFAALVSCAVRAREAGRFSADADAEGTATRYWIFGHGLAMLVINGVLPASAIAEHASAHSIALFVAAGDDPAAATRSVCRGWKGVSLPSEPPRRP